MSKLTVRVEQDEFTAKVAQAFDYEGGWNGVIETKIPDFEFPEYNSYNIGLIVGASGSGKSTILRNLVESDEEIQWEPKKAIVSHFDTPDEAIEKLHACGLASVPTLCKPYQVLSNGEKYRAKFARLLEHDLVMDEFTSEVNRETAKSLCVCVSKYIRKKNLKNIVLASCHKDIIPWLQPDWVFDCDSGERFDNDDPVGNLNKVAKIEIY
jgi:ABC-type ATPase with predicted acetyltransferase domain